MLVYTILFPKLHVVKPAGRTVKCALLCFYTYSYIIVIDTAIDMVFCPKGETQFFMNEFFIGDIPVKGVLGLAPMAGVTDMAFRTVCRGFGASYTVSEMVSAKALTYRDKKTFSLLCRGEGEKPFAVQIFGSDPGVMAEGARIALELSGADIVDINMGCPAPKIVGSGEGSALMRNTALASRIIAAVVSAANAPVTVKFRSGWDACSVNAPEFARMAEAAGASALCIHARTRDMMYSGRADRAVMRAVCGAVRIPVIANGDIRSPEDAAAVMEETGARFALCGRGALGRPWVFSGINDAPLSQRVEILLRHAELAFAQKGEYAAARELRKHIAWYLKGIKNSAPYKEKGMQVSSRAQLHELAYELLSHADQQ